MLNTILKLAALAGIVGIGFVFLAQAQRGVNQPVNQQQNHLAGPELAELERPSPEEMEPVFSEGVIQSEPVFDEAILGNNPEQTQSPSNADESLQQAEEDQFRTVSFESTGENHAPSGDGLDFSDSASRILKNRFDGSQMTGSPAVLPENEFSETPKPLLDSSSSDSSDSANQPNFDSSAADSREPLISSDAETPGDLFLSIDRNTNTETQGAAISLPKSSFSIETPGDSVPLLKTGLDAEIPGDFVSTLKGKLNGETPGDAISFDSMPNSSKNSLSPFGTTNDAANSSDLESSKKTNPISKSQDQPNPFDSSQDPGSNNVKQIHPLIDDKSPTDNFEKSDITDAFFPSNEIDTNGTNNSKGNEASSPPSTASPFTSRESYPFDSELSPVPTTNAETTEFDQPEALPDETFPPILPDREEEPLTVTGPPVSSAESRDQDTSEAPLLLDDSPSPVHDDSPNPFDMTPNAAQLKSNSSQPSDGAGNRDNPHAAQHQPQLNIEKVAPQNAVLGAPMIYSIIVQNMGNLSVHQVMVVDRIPKGTELMGTIPQAELDGNRLIWKIGTFQPNEIRKILVRITPREVGQIGSVATVHFFSEVAAETNIKKSHLKLSLSGPSQARLGEPVVYRFKVTNTGSKDAKQVFIRDILPKGLTHPGGKDLEYAVGTLHPGESDEIELTLTAESPGTTANRALVTAEGGVKIEKSLSLKILASPLIISRTGAKQVYVDRPTTAINLLTNDSNRPLERITVTESIPRGMKFVEASSEGRYDPATKSVEWSIDQLGPKQSTELKVKLVPTVEGTQTSVVQAIDANGTKIEVFSQTVILGSAALNVDIVSLEQPIAVGDQHTLRVFARNRGSASATKVQARFFVPDELEFISAQGPAQYVENGKRIVFSPVPEVKVGMQAIYNLTFKARQSGKARIRVDINADQFNQPLISDEAILIIPAN